PSPRSNSLGTGAVDRALPLRHAVRDDLGRFHRRVAQLHVAGDLALHPLALAAQEVAQPLQLRDQLLDFQHRRTCYTLNERIDLRGALFAAFDHRRRPARRSKFLTHEAADFSLDLVYRRSVFCRPAGPDDVHACPRSFALPLATLSSPAGPDHAGDLDEMTAELGRVQGIPGTCFARSRVAD